MSLSSAGNPTAAHIVIVKTGPNAGGTTTVHKLVPGSTDVEVALAARDVYAREQRSVSIGAREEMAKAEIAGFCANLSRGWPDAVTAKIDADEDGDEMAWVTLYDIHGAPLSDGDDEGPSDLLAQYDYELVRQFEGQTLNIAETAVSAGRTGSVSDLEQLARGAEENIAKADIADFCAEIVEKWPDAESVTFEADADGDDILWVTLRDKLGDTVDAGDEPQNRFQEFDYDRISDYAGRTVNVAELSAWKPAL